MEKRTVYEVSTKKNLLKMILSYILAHNNDDYYHSIHCHKIKFYSQLIEINLVLFNLIKQEDEQQFYAIELIKMIQIGM
jgi:hypothetical protein